MSLKILVIRVSSIGDIVLTTPVFRCLKKQLNAEVDHLVKPAFSKVLSTNEFINNTLHFGSFRETVKLIREQKYDYIIDLQNNLKSKQLCLFSGAKWHAVNKENWKKWRMVNLKDKSLHVDHIVKRYLAACSALGVVDDKKGLDYPLSSDVLLWCENWLKQCRIGVKNFISLVLGAAHHTKQIPEQKLREIIKNLGGTIILIGGKSEFEIGEKLAEDANVINTAGQLSIQQSAAILATSKCVVTPDTGMMHIASALQVPIISVWGNTVPLFGMYPYLPEDNNLYSSYEVFGLKCRPCSKIGHDSCPEKHFRCMGHDFSHLQTKIQEITHSRFV